MGKAVGVMLKFMGPTEKEEDVIVILNHNRLPEARRNLSEGSILLDIILLRKFTIHTFYNTIYNLIYRKPKRKERREEDQASQPNNKQ